MSSCIGIFIYPEAMLSMFNYELAMRQGASLISHHDFGGDPEILRQRVQTGLARSHPHVVVNFWDVYAELEMETIPKVGDYCLIISLEAPMYSRSKH